MGTQQKSHTRNLRGSEPLAYVHRNALKKMSNISKKDYPVTISNASTYIPKSPTHNNDNTSGGSQLLSSL